MDGELFMMVNFPVAIDSNVSITIKGNLFRGR